MNNKKILSNAIKIAILSSTVVASSAYSDDIEIYNAQGTGTNFNMMFMTDTSGSMGWDNRMNDMKTALKSVLGTMNSKVNVGLGSFSYAAGVVDQPIAPLDSVSNYLTEKVFTSKDAHEVGGTVYETNNELSNGSLLAKSSVTDGYVALNFTKVNVPSNVEIYGSTLTLYPSKTNPNKVLFEVSIENTNTPTALSNSGSLLSTMSVGSTMQFEVDWVEGEPVEISIDGILKERFGLSNWCGNNDLNIKLKFLNTGNGAVYMFGEESTSFASHLKIKYLPLGSSCATVEDEVYEVQYSSDDAEQVKDNWSINNYQDLLVNPYGYLGFRFLTNDLSKSTINNVNLLLTEKNISGVSNASFIRLRIYGENRSDATDFPNRWKGLQNKSKTTSYVDWIIPRSYDGAVHASPNLINIVNELKARSDWAEDSPVSLIIENLGSTYFGFYSLESNQYDKVPTLLVDYNNGQTLLPSIAPKTHKTILTESVDALVADGITPLQGQQMESYYYFMGDNVHFGQRQYTASDKLSSVKSIGPGFFDSLAYRLKDDPDGRLKYETPLGKRTCDINALVMLTDGAPTGSLYVTDPENGKKLHEDFTEVTGKACSTSNLWQCSYDLASYMYNNDLMPNVKGVQNVITYTIGMDLSDPAGLPNLAKVGGGKYYDATNATDLSAVFNNILNEVYDKESSVVVPGISVDQASKYQTKDELYYALFKPKANLVWDGNLKRYKLDTSGTVISGEQYAIVDKNNDPAIDPATQFFYEDSTSFWTNFADGTSVLKGGAVGQIPSTRKVFTTPDSNPVKNYLMTDLDVISSTNNNINAVDYGLPFGSTITPAEISSWIRGVDVLDRDGDANKLEFIERMGATLHSRPLVVNYTDTDSTVFVSTTDGLLHAFDSATGKEIFAFMPNDLLPQAYRRFLNEKDPGAFPVTSMMYGLDSPWVAYRHDANKDGKIIKSDGDFVYLYGGMRRGGGNYYALDVTDIYAGNSSKKAKLKFILGPGYDSKMSNMGQSWSVPVLAKVKIGTSVKVVMIFGGGYDAKNDSETYIQDGTDLGAQIYMVDAVSGDVLWKASNASDSPNTILNDMKYSIAAPVSVADFDGDGLIDTFYAADLGGQVFRFDINNGSNVSSLVSAKTIAKLGVSYYAHTFYQRRFYEKPIIVPMLVDNVKTMGVALGSGYRSHPLNKSTSDGFFMIFDREVFNPTDSTKSINTPYYPYHLSNVTYNLDSNNAATAAKTNNGYYISFRDASNQNIGEKVLSEASIINDVISFTTYVPGVSANECSPAIGETRNYSIRLYSGTPVSDKVTSDLDRTDRYSKTVSAGLGGSVKTLFTDKGAVNIGGTTVEDANIKLMMGAQRGTWKQLTPLEAKNFRINEVGASK